MTFTLTIRIVDDALYPLVFSGNPEPVTMGAALQALDAAKQSLLARSVAPAQASSEPDAAKDG